MEYEIEYTDNFEDWWISLTEAEQIEIAAVVQVLEQKGPNLPFPYSSDIRGSKYGNMRELRVQYAGRPYRILYAFDPRRIGILLLGGDKTGDNRWYKRFVPKADKLYDQHLKEIEHELKNKKGDA